MDPLPESRQIRVFISSTFRDMRDEREELTKRVFPKLRQLCEERHVVWGDVDLRWGITDEQSAEGAVLPICLEEIRRCRPYFIGLLGERYGWVPDEGDIPKDLLEGQQWLDEHKDKSVTELEILHGVLNDPEMSGHAFFYFRDPSYVDRLPTGADRANHVSRSKKEKDKLRELKNKILAHGFVVPEDERVEAQRARVLALADEFPVRKDYTGPRALGHLVLTDLTELIERLFPANEIPDPLDREASEHEDFARSRAVVEIAPGQTSGVYIGRPKYFERLDAHASGDGAPLVVLGEPGSGKSALLSNWALRYRAAHRDDFLLMHFIGGTLYSADWTTMAHRIMGELKRRFGIEQDIPDKPDELRSAFGNWLSMSSAQAAQRETKIVLILDALNQLEDRDQTPDLVWLPPTMPDGVRLIVSTLPGRPLDEIAKRQWPTMRVEPLTSDERKELIPTYLAQYAKSLSPERIERIAGAPQSANPLYLHALLEELRLFGVHEELGERIEYYLETENIPALYERVLERWEKDYERDRPGLVRDAMRLVWAARRGLSEVELLDMLGSDSEPLPPAIWSPLHLAADAAFINRSGLTGFAHDYLREAARHRYLPDRDSENAVHLHIARYFFSSWEKAGLAPRVVDEMPWQLSRAGKWQELGVLFADLPFLHVAYNVNDSEVRGHWSKIEANSNLRIAEAYRRFVEIPDKHDRAHISSLADLFAETGHPIESLHLRTYLVEQARQAGDQENLLDCLGHQAGALHALGRLDGALNLCKERERLCRALDDKNCLVGCLGHMAIILKAKGDLNGAIALLNEQKLILGDVDNKSMLGTCLLLQAEMLQTRGDLEGALGRLKQAECIQKKLGNMRALGTCLSRQGEILLIRTDLNGALALYEESARISREAGVPGEIADAMGAKAHIMALRGDFTGSLALEEETANIWRQSGNSLGLATSLVRQALILTDLGKRNEAMTLHKEAERIHREQGRPENVAEDLANQAVLLAYHMCRPTDGLPLVEEAYRLASEHGFSALAEKIRPHLEAIRSMDLPGCNSFLWLTRPIRRLIAWFRLPE